MRHWLGWSSGGLRDGKEADPGPGAGGRVGCPPRAADRGPGDVSRPVRRAVPGGGLHPLQPGQRRAAAHLRADPVQEPQPEPAHHDHVAAEQPAGQLRDAGPGPAAARPALAVRVGRRDLPVAEPDLLRPAGPGRGDGRRPRVPDGPAADDRAAPGLGGGGHGGRAPGAQGAGGGLRGAEGRPGTATGSRRSWRSRPTRRGTRARRTRRWCPWATTCSTPPCWSTR